MLQNRSASTVVLLLVLAAVNLALVGLWSITSDDIARESVPIENLQLVALAAAIIVFAHSGNISGNVFRPFLFFLCIGCVYLLFREVDFRTMPVWDWVRLLSSSVMRKGIQGIILLVLAGYLWRNLAAFRNAVSRLRPGDVWPYVCVFVLFMLAKGAEEISPCRMASSGKKCLNSTPI